MMREKSPDDGALRDDLTRLVAATAPPDSSFDRPALRAAVQALLDDTLATAPSPAAARHTAAAPTGRRRRRIRPMIAASVALMSIGTAAAAATTVLQARTGEQAERTTETPTGGEWIRLDAADAPEVLAELARPIPLPPGTDVDAFVARWVMDEPASMTDDGLQGAFALRAATCEWPAYWLDADTRGDAHARTEAQAALDAAPTWTWITAVDGGGVADNLHRVAGDLRSGDTTSAREAMAANSC